MPQMQWLGTMPKKEYPMAKVLGEGTKGFMAGMEKGQATKLALDKIDYGKKKSTADIMIKALDNATPQQRDDILKEGSDTSSLIKDVYGQEALDALGKVTAGRGKAASVAKVTTWFRTKRKNIMGYPTSRSKEQLEIDAALELKDADWKKNYPELSAELDVAFPTVAKPEKKRGWWGRRRDTGYKGMEEKDLYNKAVAGDKQAIEEAIRRGYPVGGK